MRLPASLLLLATLCGCGNLTEVGGVAGLDVLLPIPPSVEVGQTITLQARPFDAKGQAVTVPVTWVTPDNTIALTTDGKLTGLTPGSARIQAQAASIVSDFLTINVILPPDTLALTGDSILTVPTGTTASGPLLAGLFSRQSGSPVPVVGRKITYQVTSPTFADPSQGTVELPGQALTYVANTGSDGIAFVPGTPATATTPAILAMPVTLSRAPGSTGPVAAIVTVSATTGKGVIVPGSGQRFTINFK